MGLDVFVMPIWKFKVGDFTSPIEAALGIRPRYATDEGVDEIAPNTSWWARFKAKREVAAIRKAVARANGVKVDWRDDGQKVLSERWPDFAALSAYAYWLDCRETMPEFAPPPDGDYRKHPVYQQDVTVRSCPQIVGHSLYNGYVLPCDFPSLVQVEPYKIFGTWDASRSVGSAPQMLRELNAVREVLNPNGDDSDPESDPLDLAKQDERFLRELVETSISRDLPIIFWG